MDNLTPVPFWPIMSPVMLPDMERLDDPTFWEEVEWTAAAVKANGCSGVPEFYHQACLLHDCYYRLGVDFTYQDITRRESDRRFRQAIQARSFFGRISPMAWWRWVGVRRFGSASWNAAEQGVNRYRVRIARRRQAWVPDRPLKVPVKSPNPQAP